MHQNDKLLEAKYFFERLEESGSDYEATVFNLSAFVTATKAALQYELENMTNDVQRQWFFDYIDSKPVFIFFKNLKTICIHNNPLTSTKEIEVEPSFEVEYTTDMDEEAVDDYMLINIFEKLKKGQELTNPEVEIIERCSFKLKDKNLHGMDSFYRFSDWKGMEDMIELCSIYIRHLEHFFSKAERKGFSQQRLKRVRKRPTLKQVVGLINTRYFFKRSD